MAGVVEGFRWTLLGEGNPPSMILLASFSIVIVLFISSLVNSNSITHSIQHRTIKYFDTQRPLNNDAKAT